MSDWPASHTMLILLGLCFTVTAVWGLYVLLVSPVTNKSDPE